MSVFRMTIGNPIPTQAIIHDEGFSAIENRPYVHALKDSVVLTLALEEGAPIWGLGQQLGGINKRGRVYGAYCTDDPHHTEDKTTLYGAHNFFVIGGKKPLGFYIDFPGRVQYDVAFTDPDQLSVTISGTSCTLYEIQEDTVKDVLIAFRKMIGKPYLPPKWALGYFQSRWGYASESDLLGVKAAFETNDLPLEGIYVDIDYMEAFKDFTIDTQRYPDFKGLNEMFQKDNQYLIPIIDAGVKIEPGYALYEEGLQHDYFVKNKEQAPYVAAVWPGHVHFPDFLKPEVRKWFGDWYQFLYDLGIRGIWNDMNEPAIFYDPETLEKAIDYATSLKGKALDIHSFFSLGDVFRNLSNQLTYYETMQHDYLGQTYSNDTLHNLYGYYMTQAAYEGLERINPDQRHLILSRASHVGMHRYGGIWTGDNASWWSHLALNVQMMPSLNMVGFLFTGADTGGFGGHCSGELLTRWLQVSVFTPLLRNHSAIGTRDQEPYQFGQRVLDHNREIMYVRYRLLPYLYSTMIMAWEYDTLMFKPLALEFDDDRVNTIEDQLLLGDELMIAPVVLPNQKGRMLYFPEDMTLIRLKKDQISLAPVTKGDHFVPYALDEVVCFLRRNKTIPIAKACQTSADLDTNHLTWVLGQNQAATFEWYDDDGQSQVTSPLVTTHVTISETDDFQASEKLCQSIVVKRPE